MPGSREKRADSREKRPDSREMRADSREKRADSREKTVKTVRKSLTLDEISVGKPGLTFPNVTLIDLFTNT